jgi:hypothetical protein
MSKLIIVSDTASAAVMRAERLGLTRDDITIVTRLDRIVGFRDMLMVYAGEPYLLEDFYDILDYATSHDIKTLQWGDANNTQAPVGAEL